MTGVTHKHLMELVARGLMPTLAPPGSKEKVRHRFRRTDVDAFMANLFDGAQEVTTPDAKQVSVGAARHIASAGIGVVLDAVVGGRLTWKGSLRGGRRFPDLLVDVDEVRRLVRVEPPRTGLTKREVVTVVPGLWQHVVVALIALGHLDVIEEFCPTSRRRIPVVTRESVDAFRKRYVTVAEIGKLRRIPARMALRILREANQKAAFDAATVSAWIYERSDVLGDAWPTNH